jgi:transcriptional antiterminator RfaH
MPLLLPEPFLYPSDLFEGGDFQPESGSWWALHTRPRAEKCLARRLFRSGITFFLPTYRRQWRSRGQVLRSYLPLFPGYIFVLGDFQAVRGTGASRLIANYLRVVDQQQLYCDLKRIQCLIASGTTLEPQRRLAPGMWVEVTSGPLTGLTGKIIRCGKQERFLVEVQFLHQGVLADLEGETIQPVDGTRSGSPRESLC